MRVGEHLCEALGSVLGSAFHPPCVVADLSRGLRITHRSVICLFAAVFPSTITSAITPFGTTDQSPLNVGHGGSAPCDNSLWEK